MPKKLIWIGTITSIFLLCLTGMMTNDRLTWSLEVAPVVIALPLICITCRRYPFTPLSYTLIYIHCFILIYGGMYTYAHTPLGFWIQDLLELNRNPYDKLGHFFQGMVPALIAYEILVRGKFINGRKLLYFIVCCIVLAISAFYELIEWAAALLLGQNAQEFLGMQGDMWDTQSDMFCALLGAIFSLVCLRPFIDKQLLRK